MWRHAFSTVALALVVACSGNQRTPLAPSSIVPSTAGPIPAPLSLSGVVYELDGAGRQPLAGVGIDISPEYQSWPPSMVTDADGRFSVPAAARGLKIIATKADYSQPCRVPVDGSSDHYEVFLVRNAVLAVDGVPASLPLPGPLLKGRVFERTTAGDQPIAGASVVIDFTGGMGWAPSATTITDALGRYVVCNVANASGLGPAALVSKAGFIDVFVDIGLSAPGTFDVELRRR